MTRKIVPVSLIGVGLAILVVIVGPIGWQQLRFGLRPKLIDPTEVSGRPEVLAASLFSGGLDYTDSTTWFPENLPPPPVTSKVRYYNLSIPKININSVPVEINGSDLKKNVIQYPGTAIPGNYGNTVLFGHSTLPQLAKPNDPLSAFTSLPKVKRGDEIVVTYDGVIYRYIVRETAEVLPTQIEVLAQRYDKHELTLITCVPLGTYLRRFVARAELIN